MKRIINPWCSVLIGLATGGAEAAIHHVTPEGSNSGSGSETSPWATPGWASKQIMPGDTLRIHGGRYVLSEFWEDMITPPSGTADNPTVIEGDADSPPVLAGRNNLFSAIELSGVRHIIIKALEITSDNGSAFREGVSAWDPCSDVHLENLSIHHMDEFGVDLRDVDGLTITECEITHCGFGAVGGPQGVHGGWRNITISACELSWSGHYYQGIHGPGSSPYDRPDGLGLEPSEGPLIVEDCRVRHNVGDGLDSKLNNTFIRRCIVENNRCDGIKLWGGGTVVENTLIYGTGDGDAEASPWASLVIHSDRPGTPEFTLIHCTISGPIQKPGYLLYSQYDESEPIRVRFINCILQGGAGTAYFGPSVDLSLSHCLIDREGAEPLIEANGRSYSSEDISGGLLGDACITGDPLFTSPAWGSEGDYTLREGSPALDAGVLIENPPVTDLAHHPRVSGTAPDIGAYERLTTRVPYRNRSNSPGFLQWEPRTRSLQIENGTGHLTVYNILGRHILSRPCRVGETIRMEWSAGHYFALFRSGLDEQVLRFTVLR